MSPGVIAIAFFAVYKLTICALGQAPYSDSDERFLSRDHNLTIYFGDGVWKRQMFARRNHLVNKQVTFAAGLFFVATLFIGGAQAQVKKIRVATPGYTVSMLPFFAAKMNGYYAAEGLDVDLLATRAPTANLAVLSGSVEFSAVPLAGLTTALRGAPLKLLFVPSTSATGMFEMSSRDHACAVENRVRDRPIGEAFTRVPTQTGSIRAMRSNAGIATGRTRCAPIEW